MAHFVGIIEGSGDVWGVRIPDFPGCHGGGATADEAIADAISAMEELARFILEDGDPLPTPRSPEEVMRDPKILAELELEPGAAFILLPFLVGKDRTVRANISIEAWLLEEIDKAARKRGLTRSAFLASAARDKIRAEA